MQLNQYHDILLIFTLDADKRGEPFFAPVLLVLFVLLLFDCLSIWNRVNQTIRSYHCCRCGVVCARLFTHSLSSPPSSLSLSRSIFYSFYKAHSIVYMNEKLKIWCKKRVHTTDKECIRLQRSTSNTSSNSSTISFKLNLFTAFFFTSLLFSLNLTLEWVHTPTIGAIDVYIITFENYTNYRINNTMPRWFAYDYR